MVLFLALPWLSSKLKPMLAAPRSFPTLCFTMLFCICSFPLALYAQSTEADITAKLKGKPLYLRGFWREDKLQFDSKGQLQGKSGNITFTLGGFDLTSAHLDPDRLVLKGRRVGLELANNQQKRILLHDSIHIEIAASPTSDYSQALDTIFVDGLANLVPLLPIYWQDYAQKSFLPAATIAPLTPQTATPIHVASKVTTPKLLYSSEQPTLNEQARELKYGGTVIVNLWIEPDGKPSHLTIRQALGLGLDESALAAAQRYVFSPAKENGQPIRVELNSAINFGIF
jgi:TonB family protein